MCGKNSENVFSLKLSLRPNPKSEYMNAISNFPSQIHISCIHTSVHIERQDSTFARRFRGFNKSHILGVCVALQWRRSGRGKA